MRNAGGYVTVVDPDGGQVRFDKFTCEVVPSGLTERDTFTCCHCNKVVIVKPFANMDDFGSMCRNCMKMTCPVCADKECTPFMKKIEEMEKRDFIRRTYET